ncbi:MAG TPA: hypothetical protein VKM35_09970 [Arenimonas sp.]|uniref:hypothetical protein n=1 Tax=Arenimonas sp. TaxID=1872635 RepID=UPI002D08A314|nr:hypothetical protein [Arenimonas sp.]HMB57522.1 hypothetical protein [Arenimonas sp.]
MRHGSDGPHNESTTQAQGPRPHRWLIAGLLIVLMSALTGCGDQYPSDWPGTKGMFIARKGWSCPNLEGDYTDVNSQILVMFGVGSERDRWRDHHARITQADDGSWLRLDLGLNAKGMRAARGEQLKGEPPFGGLGRSITLKENAQYFCRSGWLYSIARQDTGGDDFRYEELRMGQDHSGALIVGETVSSKQSIGWGDSPGIPLGRGTRTRWYRWPLRDPGDEAAVARLEGVRLRRASWINHGSEVPTYFSNLHTRPICARLVQPWRTIKEKPVITRANTTTDTDDNGKPWGCPEDSGTMGAITTTIWQIDTPNTGSALGDYHVEWQSVDHLDQPWQQIPIPDVRNLPTNPD